MFPLAATSNSESPVPEARTESYYKKRPCVELVKSAARIMEEYMEENKNDHRSNDPVRAKEHRCPQGIQGNLSGPQSQHGLAAREQGQAIACPGEQQIDRRPGHWKRPVWGREAGLLKRFVPRTRFEDDAGCSGGAAG